MAFKFKKEKKYSKKNRNVSSIDDLFNQGMVIPFGSLGRSALAPISILRFIEQDHTKATYAKKIQKQEGLIDWNNSAEKFLGKLMVCFHFLEHFFYIKVKDIKLLKVK